MPETKTIKNNSDEITVLIYPIEDIVYFLASSVITKGLLLAKNSDGKIISEKVISNSNYGFLKIIDIKKAKNKTVTVCLISNEINYQKKLSL